MRGYGLALRVAGSMCRGRGWGVKGYRGTGAWVATGLSWPRGKSRHGSGLRRKGLKFGVRWEPKKLPMLFLRAPFYLDLNI